MAKPRPRVASPFLFKRDSMTHTKGPKVEIKRENTSLGWTYRIYIGGMLMGAAFSRDAADRSVPRLLAIYAQAKRQDQSMTRSRGSDRSSD